MLVFELIVLLVGIFLVVFGTGELITALRIRRITKDILKQNDELWELIKSAHITTGGKDAD